MTRGACAAGASDAGAGAGVNANAAASAAALAHTGGAQRRRTRRTPPRGGQEKPLHAIDLHGLLGRFAGAARLSPAARAPAMPPRGFPIVKATAGRLYCSGCGRPGPPLAPMGQAPEFRRPMNEQVFRTTPRRISGSREDAATTAPRGQPAQAASPKFGPDSPRTTAPRCDRAAMKTDGVILETRPRCPCPAGPAKTEDAPRRRPFRARA